MVLTDKQRQDLHESIFDYLSNSGDQFRECSQLFATAAQLNLENHNSTKYKGLLEKKWTSVVRLQKKVMDLENKIQQLQDDAKSSSSGIISRRDVMDSNGSTVGWFPKGPEKHCISGHRSPITVLFIIVSASEDATIKVWDYETGEFERTLKGHTNSVQSIAFNDSGTLLASSSADLCVKLWDFSTEGSYECLKTLRGHDHNVSAVVFFPGGDKLLSCSRDQTVRVWEIETGYCVYKYAEGVLHSDWIRDIAITSDGSFFASCGNDQTIQVVDVNTHKVIATCNEHEHVIESIVFGNKQATEILSAQNVPNGLSESSIGSKRRNDVENGTSDANLFLLSGSRDRSVRLWDARSGIQLMCILSHDNWVRSVAFHPCGKYAISAAEDKSIRVFDLQTGRCVHKVEEAHGHFLTCLDVHPTIPMIVTGSIDKLVKVWECQ